MMHVVIVSEVEEPFDVRRAKSPLSSIRNYKSAITNSPWLSIGPFYAITDPSSDKQFSGRLRFAVHPDDLQQRLHQHLWIGNYTRGNLRHHGAAGLAVDVALACDRATDRRCDLYFCASDSP